MFIENHVIPNQVMTICALNTLGNLLLVSCCFLVTCALKFMTDITRF